MAQSIKDRTFYALEVFDKEGSSLIGVWDNPSLAERELRLIAKGLVRPSYEMKETKGEKTLRFDFTDVGQCVMTGIYQRWDKGLSMRPIKMNVRLT